MMTTTANQLTSIAACGRYPATGATTSFDNLTVRNPLRYRGAEGYLHLYGRDACRGWSLYLAGARVYHTGVGRWLTEDPLLGNLGDPMSFNRYLYTNANPVDYSDPSGLALAPDARCKLKTDKAPWTFQAGLLGAVAIPAAVASKAAKLPIVAGCMTGIVTAWTSYLTAPEEGGTRRIDRWFCDSVNWLGDVMTEPTYTLNPTTYRVEPSHPTGIYL